MIHETDINGSPAMWSDESMPFEQLVSGAVEMIRRQRATRPEPTAARQRLAEMVFPGVVADLAHVDPQVVCEVVIRLLSSGMGPMFARDIPPEAAINAMVMGALQHAGYLDGSS